MNKLRIPFAVFVTVLLPALASAVVTKRIPIVTQVQGAVFYRTFVMIGNASDSPTAVTTLTLTYRSPVDGTLQTQPLNIASLPGGEAQKFDDIIQTFKDSAAIRTEDIDADIFGTLTVSSSALTRASDLVVIARTYSPANGGGTNGIAYLGRSGAGSTGELVTFLNNGDLGPGGVTRANLGIVNESNSPADAQITYRDPTTGALLRQFRLSEVSHRQLGPAEVFQLNNVFDDPAVPIGTAVMSVEVRPIAATRVSISGYAVQLDSVTNDGSFFVLGEVGAQ